MYRMNDWHFNSFSWRKTIREPISCEWQATTTTRVHFPNETSKLSLKIINNPLYPRYQSLVMNMNSIAFQSSQYQHQQQHLNGADHHLPSMRSTGAMASLRTKPSACWFPTAQQINGNAQFCAQNQNLHSYQASNFTIHDPAPIRNSAHYMKQEPGELVEVEQESEHHIQIHDHNHNIENNNRNQELEDDFKLSPYQQISSLGNSNECVGNSSLVKNRFPFLVSVGFCERKKVVKFQWSWMLMWRCRMVSIDFHMKRPIETGVELCDVGSACSKKRTFQCTGPLILSYLLPLLYLVLLVNWTSNTTKGIFTYTQFIENLIWIWNSVSKYRLLLLINRQSLNILLF